MAEYIIQKKREAITAYEAKDYELSERSFYQVIAADPTLSSAGTSMEYLKKIFEEGGIKKLAQDEFEKTKTKTKKDHFEKPDSYFGLMQGGKFEAHLATLFKLGGFLAARSSMLGFVFSQVGMKGEGEYFFEKSIEIAEAAQKSSYREFREHLLARPLHFMVPPHYRVLGMLNYSPNQIEIVPFEFNQRTDPDIVLREPPAQSSTHINFEMFRDYNSNIIKTDGLQPLPAGVISASGGDKNYLINLGGQSNPLAEMSYGADYFYLIQNYTRDELSAYGSSTHAGGLWGSLWNRKDFEVRIRYDLISTSHQLVRKDLYTFAQGPQISLGKLLTPGLRADFTYSLKFNSDKDDSSLILADQRGGTQHNLGLQISYPGRSKYPQPYLRYNWDRNMTVGDQVATIEHRIESGASYPIGVKSVLRFQSVFDFKLYPFSRAQRMDFLKEFELSSFFPIIGDQVLLHPKGTYSTLTSQGTSESYSQWTLGIGLVLGFIL
jgi:hypothetical protein